MLTAGQPAAALKQATHPPTQIRYARWCSFVCVRRCPKGIQRKRKEQEFWPIGWKNNRTASCAARCAIEGTKRKRSLFLISALINMILITFWQNQAISRSRVKTAEACRNRNYLFFFSLPQCFRFPLFFIFFLNALWWRTPENRNRSWMTSKRYENLAWS